MGNGGSLSLTTLTSSVTKVTLWGYDANQGLTGKPMSIDCGSAPLASGLMAIALNITTGNGIRTVRCPTASGRTTWVWSVRMCPGATAASIVVGTAKADPCATSKTCTADVAKDYRHRRQHERERDRAREAAARLR